MRPIRITSGESQAFGVRALTAGVDGIRYLVRHDPAQRLYGLALFGDRKRRNRPIRDGRPAMTASCRTT